MGQRFALGLAAVALVLAGAPVRTALAAKHKKKTTSSKTKDSDDADTIKLNPSKLKMDDGDDASGKSAAAAADSGDDDGKSKAPATKKADDDTADDSDDESSATSKPTAAKTKKKAAKDADEDDAGGDEDEAPVVRKKMRRPEAEEPADAAVAVDLSVGGRGEHRTFDFNDIHAGTSVAPGHYALAVAPVPFVTVGVYPLAFSTRGGLANVGIVGRYERLIGTTTVEKNVTGQPSVTTSSQDFDVGLRGRMPLGQSEVALAATFGQESFHVSSSDAPSATSTVPNVSYTYVRVGADGHVPAGPVTLGAHLGTRLVPKVGPLATGWFNTTKTTAFEAGVSAGYKLTPTFELDAGVDFLRYAFDFNPVQAGNPVVAGGAVDQYISGWLALRVVIGGG